MFPFLSSILGPLIGGGLSFLGASQANQMQQNNLQGGNLQALVANAQKAGLSPLAVLGGATSGGNFQNVFGDAPGVGAQIGKSVVGSSPAEDRMNALREQNLQLENARLQNDVIAGQLKNSANAVSFRNPGIPPAYSVYGKGVFGSLAARANTPDELQAVRDPSGRLMWIPSSQTQQGEWSPLGALPVAPKTMADVAAQNVGGDTPMSSTFPDVYRVARGARDWISSVFGGSALPY